MSKLGLCYDHDAEKCFAHCRDLDGSHRCKILTSGYRDKKCPFFKTTKNEVIKNENAAN